MPNTPDTPEDVREALTRLNDRLAAEKQALPPPARCLTEAEWDAWVEELMQQWHASHPADP